MGAPWEETVALTGEKTIGSTPREPVAEYLSFVDREQVHLIVVAADRRDGRAWSKRWIFLQQKPGPPRVPIPPRSENAPSGPHCEDVHEIAVARERCHGCGGVAAAQG